MNCPTKHFRIYMAALVALPFFAGVSGGYATTFRAVSPRTVDVIQVEGFVRDYVKQAMNEAWPGMAPKIAEAIIQESRKYDIDPLLVAAMIENESRFRPTMYGMHGEVGLMQIKPSTALWVSEKFGLPWSGLDTLEDPVLNIRYGVSYLAYLKSRFHSQDALYVSAYNMGVANVNKVLKRNASPSIYLNRVMKHYFGYYRVMGERSDQSKV